MASWKGAKKLGSGGRQTKTPMSPRNQGHIDQKKLNRTGNVTWKMGVIISRRG